MFQIEEPTAFSLLEKAGIWLQLGRPTEALDMLSREPLRSSTQSLRSWSQTLTCHARLLLDDPGAAIEACEKAVGGDPRIWSVHLYLAAAHAQMGHMEQARASLKVVDRMSPGHTIARLRNYRQWSHPDYKRLAEGTYYAGLRKAGLSER